MVSDTECHSHSLVHTSSEVSCASLVLRFLRRWRDSETKVLGAALSQNQTEIVDQLQKKYTSSTTVRKCWKTESEKPRTLQQSSPATSWVHALITLGLTPPPRDWRLCVGPCTQGMAHAFASQSWFCMHVFTVLLSFSECEIVWYATPCCAMLSSSSLPLSLSLSFSLFLSLSLSLSFSVLSRVSRILSEPKRS